MRKNQVGRKRLELYTTYEIKGLNLDRFINTVKNRKIDMFDVKKTSAKSMLITVKMQDSKNFFAIAEELCYNIKKVRDKGRDYPLYLLFNSFGLIIGAVIFIAMALISNDLIFSVQYSGSGSIYQREVAEYLSQVGVEPYTRFSDVDLSELEDSILAKNEHLSFASCKKRGNRLLVELVLSGDKVSTLDGNVFEMRSDVSGVLESLKVYRGTAVVNVGDTVKDGELLVDGTVTIKEQTVKTNVLACATIIVDSVYEYRSGVDGEEEKAQVLAEASLMDREILVSEVAKEQVGDEYVYTVTLKTRRVMYVG